MVAEMLSSFFAKGLDSAGIFDRLQVANIAEYREHLNRHEVIYIDCSVVPEGCRSYREYIQNISMGIKADIEAAYPIWNWIRVNPYGIS